MDKTYKYISAIPKPLLDDFIHNKVVPIIGAGFSKNADIPDGISMPDWNQLGKIIAEEIPEYEFGNNALDTLSYYETLFSRPKLIELLIEKLNIGKVQPGSTYTAFCDVFANIVCTTNFDFLLEDAYRALRQPISVIATEDRLSIDTDGETRLIKLHGDFNHPDRMVITERDYDMYMENNPILSTYISNLFITKTMLLIGYSLDDYDFRNIWQVINSHLGNMTRPAYCITVGATHEKIARYQRRNIKIINLNGKTSDYKTILRDFFVELKEYIADENAKMAISTNEKINEQLLLPSDSNRLCYISCAMSRISRLKELLYPILQEIGVTPVRIDDMILPSSDKIAISRMAIRKANMAIVDISDSNHTVMFELGMIKAEKKRSSIILISENSSRNQDITNEDDVIKYSFDWLSEDDKISVFRDKIKLKCNHIIGTIDHLHRPFEEAERLLKSEDFSACIISIFSELEMLFKNRHDEILKSNSMLATIKEYSEKGYYDESTYSDAIKYYIIRNKIIHSGYVANAKEARQVLKFAQSFNQKDAKFIQNTKK